MPTHAFEIVLVVLAAALAALGWVARRLVNRMDSAHADKESALQALQDERIATVERHYNRNMDAIADIARVVAENNAKLTDHWQDVTQRLAHIEGMFGEWLTR